MNSKQLADQIVRSMTGPMWHGPALEEVLAETTSEQAAAHPIPDAHSIWELVLHMTTWARIPHDRLAGRSLEYPNAEIDWPRVPEPTDEAWRGAVRALAESHATLAGAVERLTEEELQSTVAGQKHPTWAMLHGVVEHACYHGGQIPILKKASQGRTVPSS